MRAKPARHTGGTLAPLGVALAAFVYRLLTLRDLTNDHFMQLAWAQQLRFGELPGRDFVDPGQPLASTLSALGQWVRPGPFSEAVLCGILLAAAVAFTYRVVERLTQSAGWGLIAAAGCLALAPRLYNYPKLLVPAVVLWLVQRYSVTRSSPLLVGAGIWAVIATLLRHDLGIYAAIGTLAGVLAVEWGRWRHALRAVATVTVTACAAAVPYLAYVWWTEGLAEHLRLSVEFARGETHQLRYDWPLFPSLSPIDLAAWGRADSVASLYYLCLLLPAAGIVALLFRAARIIVAAPTIIASLALLISYSAVVLRDPLDQRLPDLAVPLLVSAIPLLVGALRSRPLVLRLASAVVVFVASVSIANLGRVRAEFAETQLMRGPRKVSESLAGKASAGTAWPWARFWPNSGGLPPAVLYLNACTTPEDAIMLTWSSPEYYFFTQRRFAGGHALVVPMTYALGRDEDLMLARLSAERPVIVLVNETARDDFAAELPEVDDFIARHYVRVDSFTHYDGDIITIALRRDLRGRTTYGEKGWPCQFVEEVDPRVDLEG